MRSFFWALTLAMLPAATAAAQLLADPRTKDDNKPVPGRPAANAKADANAGRAGIRAAAVAQPNAMFAAIDADGDGKISKVELRKAIKALKTLDTDEDGSITLAEASVGSGGGPVGLGGPLEDPQLAQIMANDRDNNGQLSPNEVPNELLPMLQRADQNQNGAIDRQELAAAMAAMRNQFGAGPGGPWRGGLNGPGGVRNDQQATGEFLRYDANRDGKLTEDELPANAKRILKDGDENGDNALDAGELQAAMAKLGDRSKLLRAGLDPDEVGGRGVKDRDRKRAGSQR